MRQKGKKAETPGWLVAIVREETGVPELLRFPDLEALRKELIALPKDCWAVPLFGIPLHMSQPPDGSDREYLVIPDGRSIPLFEEIEELTIKDHYYRGEPDQDLVPVDADDEDEEATQGGDAEEDDVEDSEPEANQSDVENDIPEIDGFDEEDPED